MSATPIALCITDLDVGGAERAVAGLATRLDRSRFEPRLYCLAPPPPDERRACVDMLETAGVPIVYLNARSSWGFPAALGRLCGLLKAQRPKLLQCFLFHANVLGRVAGRLARVPHVLSGLRVAERGSRWHLWMDRATQRLVDRYVCVSQSVARFAQNEGGLAAAKLTVIPNGIDLADFPGTPADLRPLGISPGRSPVTFVGRLDHQKDVHWLLRAVPRVFSAVPLADLLIVGSGPLEDNLREFAGQMGIAKRTFFAGFRPDVPAILAASRVLVLPSRWEGMPNVVLEAMASRLPVVASDVEGVRELLGQSAEAQTVPPADSDALASSLIRILQDQRLCAQLAAENRLRAEESFSIDRTVAAYQDLWEGVL